MTLTPGARLGPYEVLNAVGAGGMGEVYAARDTRLDRRVAIKILSEEVAADAGRRARFMLEARAISRLTHSNICTLYDVGEQGGLLFLVMELLEGQTLATRIASTPQRHAGTARGLPIAEALRIAVQIGEALAHAHRAGIVHRDLKPANVMLTESGAKLLDFGVAKLREADEGEPAETRTPLSTADGQILGTLAYMAPEQLDGKADHRSDLFALGAVLYEMLVGQRAFPGDSPSSVMRAILAGDPPALRVIRADLPPSLDRIVKKCLARDPNARWQSARDLTDELIWLAQPSGVEAASAAPATTTLPAPAPVRRWREPLAWGLAAALGVGLLARQLWPTAEVARGISALAIPLESPEPFAEWGPDVAVSPDGKEVAYAGARVAIHVRRLDRSGARALAGAEGQFPFFSPDGQWVAFFAGMRLFKIPLAGGAAVELATFSAPPFGGHWGPDGRIVAGGAAGLAIANASGGEPHAILTFDPRSGRRALAPQFLPGGQTVLFTLVEDSPDGPQYRLMTQAVAGGDPRLILDDARFGLYAGQGRLVYQQGGSLYATDFDLDRSTVGDPGAAVADNLYPRSSARSWAYAAGTLAYTSGRSLQRQMIWVGRDGRASDPLPLAAQAYEFPRISPDGRRFAVEIFDSGSSAISVYDFERGMLTNLGASFYGAMPTWSPDGTTLAYTRRSASPGSTAIVRQLADGSAQPQILVEGILATPRSWTPDGRTLVHSKGVVGRKTMGVWALTPDGPEPRDRVIVDGVFGGYLSPNGRWVAYFDDQKIFVSEFPSGAGRWQISTARGREPVWSRQGDELFYWSGNQFMSVPVSAGARFSAGRPQLLFEGRYEHLGGWDLVNYDVSPDGQRFLMIRLVNPDQPAYLDVVLGFDSVLLRDSPDRR